MKLVCEVGGVFLKKLKYTGYHHQAERYKKIGGNALPTCKMQMCLDDGEDVNPTNVAILAGLSDMLGVPLTSRYDEEEEQHIVEIEVVSAVRVQKETV